MKSNKQDAAKDKFLNIRVPADVLKTLKQIASREVRTLASQTLVFIKQGIDADQKKN